MTARFKPGDRVRVADRKVTGHVRTPLFLRGHVGEIVRGHGAFANPERLAMGEDGLPAVPLYEVRFLMHELWRDAGVFVARDTLSADIYEHWLEPAAS